MGPDPEEKLPLSGAIDKAWFPLSSAQDQHIL
jgi:hypothetical protein